jgi:hypothetical protein
VKKVGGKFCGGFGNLFVFRFHDVFSFFCFVGLFGGAITNETGVCLGEVKCGDVAPFVHAEKPARLVAPS